MSDFKWKDINKICYYDTETVSISPNYIITLAYICCERGKPPISGMIKCNPDYYISPEASKVNGFTNEQVKEWNLFPEEWVKIEPYFRDAVWIGHNSNKFDQSALRLEFRRYNLLEPHHYNLDTMLIAKKMLTKQDIENYKLITLCNHFSIEGDNFHTADFDTWGTREVFKKLNKLNKEKGNLYDTLFIPKEIDGEYSITNPPKREEDFDY